MIVESLDEYLETVAGYVYDNDKVVTYKWLSKELEVHVNVAKQILWEFGQRHHREELIRTFLLMGTLHDGGMRVEVVKESDLSKAKEKYSKIISEHIYSLQKALSDIELLAISGDGDVKYSAIKCNESVERSEEEMLLLRWGTSMNMEAHAEEKVKSAVGSAQAIKESLESVTKSEQKAATSKKGVTAQQKGFNSLFGKAANKQKSPTSASNAEKAKSSTAAVNGTRETSPKKTASASPKKKMQKGGLDCFVEKNQARPASAVSPEDKTGKSDIGKDKKNERLTVPSTSNKRSKDARGKKRNRSKEDSDIAKKRKRITIKSDSSDSESSNEEEEEPEQPPSPEKISSIKPRSPSPPPVKHEGGKRKVLKLVDKTFEEDGYLITKKVHVYESCSEEEEQETQKEEPKKSTASESRLDPKAKKSTKQTTLMNFFKKS